MTMGKRGKCMSATHGTDPDLEGSIELELVLEVHWQRPQIHSKGVPSGGPNLHIRSGCRGRGLWPGIPIRQKTSGCG